MLKILSQKNHQIIHFIKHKIEAGNAHTIHSPYVFNLYRDAINTDTKYYFFMPAEQLRLQLLQNNNDISVIDFGTGQNRMSTIANIASKSTKPSRQAQLLFKLIQYTNSKNIIELGTNLGLTTCYLAAVNSQNKVVSLEGNEAYVELAKKNAALLKLNNIKFVLGDFNQTLAQVLSTNTAFDFAFIDGNHTYDATMEYYHLLKKHHVRVLVFDDIYWSSGMTKAWKEITKKSEYCICIDLYCVGIVIFKEEKNYSEFYKLIF